MKTVRIILSLCTCICMYSCTSNTTGSESLPDKFIPDHTPYIAGFVEATNDTVHHFPEVVVGYVTDVEGFEYSGSLEDYPRLYNPTLLTQLVKTSHAFGLRFEPEHNASVWVTGPLGTCMEMLAMNCRSMHRENTGWK
jgi:hypothetical protein